MQQAYPEFGDATNRDNPGSADCGPSAFVEAAVEGRLPRGFGLKRLVDLPMARPDQWRTVGLDAPASA
jgi:hypothetical protein